MSCGNRFQCGLKKPSRFQFQPDKPSNPELHNENEKRLSDLLKAREDIDRQFFSKPSESNTNAVYTPENTNSISILASNDTSNKFTPWTVPSADFKKK